jgi:hypothetical protein
MFYGSSEIVLISGAAPRQGARSANLTVIATHGQARSAGLPKGLAGGNQAALRHHCSLIA